LSKKKKIEKIIKESPLNNISDDKYLNKIILGTNKPKIPL
jgi:Asp-tRNA(Asn)/Glu-tRNA(Gln) amidotransferase B subunit